MGNAIDITEIKEHEKSSFFTVTISKPLTQPQSVSWELPFAAVIGKTVTLLVERHFLWIHYN